MSLNQRRWLAVGILAGFILWALCSCSAIPRKTAVHYSPPSTATVSSSIGTAQGSVRSAGIEAGNLKTQIASAIKASEGGSVELKLALTRANLSVDTLTKQLLVTGGDLTAAAGSITQLQAEVNGLAGAANTCIDEKNAAIDIAHAKEKQVAFEQAHVHRLKFWMCSLAAGCALLVAFGFRSVLMLGGPYALAAGFVAFPAATFAACWLLL